MWVHVFFGDFEFLGLLDFQQLRMKATNTSTREVLWILESFLRGVNLNFVA